MIFWVKLFGQNNVKYHKNPLASHGITPPWTVYRKAGSTTPLHSC